MMSQEKRAESIKLKVISSILAICSLAMVVISLGNESVKDKNKELDVLMFMSLSGAIASSIVKYVDNKKHQSANQEEMSNDTP